MQNSKKIFAIMKKDASWENERIPSYAFKKHRGEHIAILNNKVIAHDRDFRKVAKKAFAIALRKQKVPVFTQIPKGEVNIF